CPRPRVGCSSTRRSPPAELSASRHWGMEAAMRPGATTPGRAEGDHRRRGGNRVSKRPRIPAVNVVRRYPLLPRSPDYRRRTDSVNSRVDRTSVMQDTEWPLCAAPEEELTCGDPGNALHVADEVDAHLGQH